MDLTIEQARGGDPQATNAVVSALRPRITKMAAYYGRRTGEDPEDLLQEAWIGVLEALPLLDMSIGSPEQHLILRARWRLLDAVKRARLRRCDPLDDAAERLQQPETAVGSACVSAFTSELKSTQRAILHGLMAGMTWREVGDVLGCTSANVAYHVRQIRLRYEKWTADGESETRNDHAHVRRTGHVVAAPVRSGGLRRGGRHLSGCASGRESERAHDAGTGERGRE